MEVTAQKRLQKELQMMNINDSGIRVYPTDDNIMIWKAVIFGPKDTPYEGGVFNINIQFTKDYPFRPPKVNFETVIFHPNINVRGDICLDILKDKWSSALTVNKILLSLSSLLSDPNPNDPLVPEAASLLRNDVNKFNERAREWTNKYAK